MQIQGANPWPDDGEEKQGSQPQPEPAGPEGAGNGEYAAGQNRRYLDADRTDKDAGCAGQGARTRRKIVEHDNHFWADRKTGR